ncbi:helix-turn-helix domain-containing protein [Francisella sp. LA112445]|jgi:DNA-binding GntR family transcriptional regulator|uniref:helix-turn-helix domain-containing protein n=1 Tax=Francisella sp. LA112445 TaxID=1395624 RepID=UPI001788D626|nr:helix-turn-helix domain-containing protein [Francisella sp. LA112445]QIW10772.1 helix-turn-helix domain-containing protein [Francisella sp. LA112445]
MKIPASKELDIKKAILKAIENNTSPAKLADSFGVSKSTIYKYRRGLVEQGFIQKNENGVYVISPNKFSIKPSKVPKTADLELSYQSESLEVKDNQYVHIKDHHVQNLNDQAEQPEEEQEVEVKILKKKQNFTPIEEPNDKQKGLLQKLFGKFIKKKS